MLQFCLSVPKGAAIARVLVASIAASLAAAAPKPLLSISQTYSFNTRFLQFSKGFLVALSQKRGSQQEVIDMPPPFLPHYSVFAQDRFCDLAIENSLLLGC